MKKTFLIVMFAALAFFFSCEKEHPVPAPVCECGKVTSCECMITTSCECKKREEVLTSLEGTYWKGHAIIDFDDESHAVSYDDSSMYELIFTSSIAIYTFTPNNGNPFSFSAPYTYDSPNLKVILKNEFPSPDNPDDFYVPELIFEGTVKGDTMTFGVWETLDLITEVELKKQ